jgi:hypothetical protein
MEENAAEMPDLEAAEREKARAGRSGRRRRGLTPRLHGRDSRVGVKYLSCFDLFLFPFLTSF